MGVDETGDDRTTGELDKARARAGGVHDVRITSDREDTLAAYRDRRRDATARIHRVDDAAPQHQCRIFDANGQGVAPPVPSPRSGRVASRTRAK
jgi:hypothetical protein